MGILSKVFNRSKEEKNNEEGSIKFYDRNGNEMFLSKNEYKKKVLPEQLKINWNNPDALYSIILMSLQDGFIQEVLKPSERLFEIDSNKERCYTVRAIVLLRNGKVSQSKSLLEKYCKKFGPTGVILTNLAKVYAEKNEQVTCMELLWKGLQLDPNQDNGLIWWATIHREKEGKQQYILALKKAAKIEGSWRPQLYLAKEYFEDGKREKALNIYEEVLLKKNLPSDALVEISGELGKNGLHQKLRDLIIPRYNPYEHSPLVGMNILQSYLETGMYNEGIRLLNKLKTLNRHDLMNYFDYYYNEFYKYNN